MSCLGTQTPFCTILEQTANSVNLCERNCFHLMSEKQKGFIQHRIYAQVVEKKKRGIISKRQIKNVPQQQKHKEEISNTFLYFQRN